MFYNKADLKKHSLERNRDEVLYWKRTPSQLFSDDFRKTFHNTALSQNASNSPLFS